MATPDREILTSGVWRRSSFLPRSAGPASAHPPHPATTAATLSPIAGLIAHGTHLILESQPLLVRKNVADIGQVPDLGIERLIPCIANPRSGDEDIGRGRTLRIEERCQVVLRLTGDAPVVGKRWRGRSVELIESSLLRIGEIQGAGKSVVSPPVARRERGQFHSVACDARAGRLGPATPIVAVTPNHPGLPVRSTPGQNQKQRQ